MQFEMPKDLDDIKSKLVLGMNSRQLISLVAAVPLCWKMWQHLSPILSRDNTMLACLAIASPILAIGFIPKEYLQGLYPEQFAWAIIKFNILRPVSRKYKTVNYYDEIAKQIKKEEEQKALQISKKLSRKEQRRQKKIKDSIKGVR